jgi:hypothetical protein
MKNLVATTLAFIFFITLTTSANAWHIVFWCAGVNNTTRYYTSTLSPSANDKYRDMDKTRFENEVFHEWLKSKDFGCITRERGHTMTEQSGNKTGYIATKEFYLKQENLNLKFYTFDQTRAMAEQKLNDKIQARAKRIPNQVVNYLSETKFTRTEFFPLVEATEDAVSKFIRNPSTLNFLAAVKNKVIANTESQNKLIKEIEQYFKDGNWPELMSEKTLQKLQENKIESRYLSTYLALMNERIGLAENDLESRNLLAKDASLKSTMDQLTKAVDDLSFGNKNFGSGLNEYQALALIKLLDQEERFSTMNNVSEVTYINHFLFATIFLANSYEQLNHDSFRELAEAINKVVENN